MVLGHVHVCHSLCSLLTHCFPFSHQVMAIKRGFESASTSAAPSKEPTLLLRALSNIVPASNLSARSSSSSSVASVDSESSRGASTSASPPHSERKAPGPRGAARNTFNVRRIVLSAGHAEL